MTRAGLIVNPFSGKSSGKGVALAGKLAKEPGVTVRVMQDFGELKDILADFAGRDIGDLYISSGDGTVQAIQTELAETSLFKSPPRLCLLPHGTTNMTAADLGFAFRGIDAQAAFIRNPLPRDLRRRPTLRAANPGDGRPRHGMFLGTGAVTDATQYCQRAFNARGVKGNWATFATLAGAVAKVLFSAPDPADLARFDRPFHIAAETPDGIRASGENLLLLSTTLHRLILGARPFWGGAAGPIRTTVLPYPVPSIARWLLPVMYGGEDRKAPPGAISFAGAALAVRSGNAFVIDGEFFMPPSEGPLHVETGPVFTYVCG